MSPNICMMSIRVELLIFESQTIMNKEYGMSTIRISANCVLEDVGEFYEQFLNTASISQYTVHSYIG